MFKSFPKSQIFTPLNLTSRIIFLNVFGLGLLVCGILYLDQFRQGLIDAKMQSLTIQARIIAAALATATGQKNQQNEQKIIIDPDQLIDLPWNKKYIKKERKKYKTQNIKKQKIEIAAAQASAILHQLIPQTNKRGYVFDMDGKLIADSYYFRGGGGTNLENKKKSITKKKINL